MVPEPAAREILRSGVVQHNREHERGQERNKKATDAIDRIIGGIETPCYHLPAGQPADKKPAQHKKHDHGFRMPSGHEEPCLDEQGTIAGRYVSIAKKQWIAQMAEKNHAGGHPTSHIEK